MPTHRVCTITLQDKHHLAHKNLLASKREARQREADGEADVEDNVEDEDSDGESMDLN